MEIIAYERPDKRKAHRNVMRRSGFMTVNGVLMINKSKIWNYDVTGKY